jgi:hypothetical protein
MSFGAFSQRGFGGGAPVPPFGLLWQDSGIVESPAVAWNNVGSSHQLALKPGEPAVSVVTWRAGKRAIVSGGDRLQKNDVAFVESTSCLWLFALQIPPDAPSFSGIGPSSTSSAVHVNKNFPLYFKSGTVIGSQPSSSNRDSSLDMSPYYGLDAVITVRQAAAGIRFSMFIDTVGPVVTTASGEAPTVGQGGLSGGGWHDMGGEYPYPIGMIAYMDGSVSDGDQDAARDWAALSQYAMAGA